MQTFYKNAHIIDPAQAIDGPSELLAENGKVVEIGFQITSANPDAETVDFKGYVLTPG